GSARGVGRQLPVEDVELVALVDGKLYGSVGYSNALEVQCQLVWLCQRHSRCGRLARVRLLWSDDSYWDWWSQCAGERGAISLRPLLHICEGPAPLYEAELPPNCTELVHTSEMARLTVEAAAELAPAAGARPFEDPFGELDEGPSAPSEVAALRSRLMESKAVPAVEDGPEVKRPLAEVLSERAAKVARGGAKLLAAPHPSDGSARGARDRGPTEGAAATAGASRAAQDLASVLARLLDGRQGSSEEMGLARRAHCRRVATEQPGRLAEASLAHMADFPGTQEGESAVDPQGAIALRWLLTAYLPQHPVREIGVPTCRELRALAEALDHLAQGRTAADLLAQRFKALQVTLHDGNWSGAKWPGHMPPRDEPTVLRSEEDELIRGIQVGELTLDELTAKLRELGCGGESSKGYQARLASVVAELKKKKGGEGAAAPSAASGGRHHGAEAGDALPPLELGAALAGTVAPRASAVGAEAALPESLPLREGSESMTAGRRRSPAELGRPMRRVDLAVELVRFAQLRPGTLGRLAGQALPVERSGAKARVRGLPPLPPPPLEEVARWAQAAKGSRRRLAPVARAVAAEAWTYMSALGLDHMHCGVARETLRLGATPTLAQETAMRRIRSRAAEFVQQPSETVAVASLGDAVATSSVDYSGEPMMRALPCAVAELAPGLPKREHEATLSAIDFVDDEVARWLADPTLARVNVGSQFEWEALAMHLVRLGIFTVLPAEELVRVRGEPLLNGLFAAEQSTPGPGASRVTRPILNVVPGNALIEPRAGEVAMLAGSTSWVSLRIPEGKLLRWPGDDQKGEPEVRLASAVIAMGWSLVAPVHRHIHRRLRRLPPPLGAGLPPQAEWRKDAPRPVAAAAEEGDSAWWQVYIDDFDVPEIVEEARARRLIGLLAEQVRARASYDRAGAANSAAKAHCRQLRVERMGPTSTASPAAWPPLAKSLEAIALCLAPFRLEAVPWRLAMTTLGRFAGLFEFRRPLFSVLSEVWRLSSQRGNARFSAAMVEELLTAKLVLPMAAASLRAKIEGVATVSASLDGAPTLDEQMHLGTRLLQLPAEPSEPWAVANPLIPRAAVLRAPKVLLVGLFNGVGGLAVAFLRLPARTMGYVAAETDAEARRVARLRWPGAIDWGDVARVAAVVNELRGACCDEVDLCAAAAGSPCQDLARLSASSAGLRGAKSGLFYEVPRLLELLKAAFRHQLKWFVENVAPVLHSSVLVPCRRPRLCWMSWEPRVAAPLAVAMRDGFREVRAPRGPLCELAWQDEGARWLGAPGLFPTLACCRPLPKFPP
ncbi:unnamed protein product, partial [Prorocentrum cordatum]